jgi:predicted DNA-binding ArsR family transcriptional regulator
MTSAETLREHAKSAVTLLAELASEEDRKYLLALAQAWLKNAKKLEEQSGLRRERQMTKPQ